MVLNCVSAGVVTAVDLVVDVLAGADRGHAHEAVNFQVGVSFHFVEAFGFVGVDNQLCLARSPHRLHFLSETRDFLLLLFIPHFMTL